MVSSRKRKQSTLNHGVNESDDGMGLITQHSFQKISNPPRNMVSQPLLNYDNNQVLKVKYDTLLHAILKYTQFVITYTDT